MRIKSILVEIADNIVRNIYKKTIDFPYKYQSSIGDQLRRASFSIILNIVESAAKFSENERKQYLKTAFSSLKESKYLLFFCKTVNLITDNCYQGYINELDRLARLLYGIISKNV